jgi:hypothetical protein
MRILADTCEWLAPVAHELDAAHDVVRLDPAAVQRAWVNPDADWWRRAVPGGWVPDVAVFTTPEYRPLPPLLSALPCPVVLWVGDWYVNGQAVGWVADQVELLLADATGVGALRRAGVRAEVAELCPWTFEPEAHRPDWDAEPLRDVGFLGNFGDALQARRNRWLERVARMDPALRIDLGTGRFGADYARWLQTSRITFNYSLTGDVNMRSFQAPACGSMTLINADAAAETARWFELGREVVVYDDSDLEDVIAHYLHHEDERAAIARAGWARVQEHGPSARQDALVALLADVAARGRRGDLPPTSRAANASARHAVSVADPAVAPGYAAVLRATPGGAAGALALAGAELLVAQAAGPDAGPAVARAAAALDDAGRQDPQCATTTLANAQLLQLVGQAEGAHAQAFALAEAIADGAAVARPDRLPLVDAIPWRRDRQDILHADPDPEPALSRRLLVEALELAAKTTDDPVHRSRLLATALRESATPAPALRLRLAIALLAYRPAAALEHTEIVVAELPLSTLGWTAHAHALLAADRPEDALAFVADRHELAQRITTDPAALAQLDAIVASVRERERA